MDDILKYERIEGALEDSVLAAGQIITSSCIEQNYVVLGTAAGAVHCLHFSGLLLKSIQALPVGQRVRHLSCATDSAGLMVACCSDAGQVVVLLIPHATDRECTQLSMSFSEPVHCTCLDKSPAMASSDARTISSTSSILYGAISGSKSSGTSAKMRPFLAGMLTGKLLLHRGSRAGSAGGSTSDGWYSSGSNISSSKSDVILFPGNGSAVQTIARRGRLVAWADASHVRVMDFTTQTAICQLVSPPGVSVQDPYPCQLQWNGECCLLVGWADNFRQVDITENDSMGAAGDQLTWTASIRHEWMTDCIICGLCGFDRGRVVLLGYTPPEEESNARFVSAAEQGDTSDGAEDTGTSQWVKNASEVEMIIADRSTGQILSADLMPLRESQVNPDGPFGYTLLSTYQCLEHYGDIEKWNVRKFRSERGGARGYAPINFITSREDFVVSRVRDVNDRVAYALQQGDMYSAVNAAHSDRAALTAYQYSELLRVYLIDVLERQQHQIHSTNVRIAHHSVDDNLSSDLSSVAMETARLVGVDSGLWEIWIYKFIEYNHIASLCSLIPIASPRLPNHVYETVLMQLLQENPTLFLETLKKWSNRTGKSAGLFDHDKMVQVLEQLLRHSSGSCYYSEALAHLHILDGQYERALNCYLDMEIKCDEDLSREHSMYEKSTENDDCKEATEVKENIEKVEYRHVFDLIEKENLFRTVEHKIINLVRLSRPLAAKLCISHVDKLPIRLIADQLSVDKRLLKWYLHLVFTEPSTCELYRNEAEFGDLHQQQLILYAEFYHTQRSREETQISQKELISTTEQNPEEVNLDLFNSQGIPSSDLLRFLESGLAALDTALQVCEGQQPPLYMEMIYILSQMGEQRRALQIHLKEIGNVGMAIAFIEAQIDGSCRGTNVLHRAVKLDTRFISSTVSTVNGEATGDDSNFVAHYVRSPLWDDLIQFAQQRPAFLAQLLDYLGICKLDPVQVISSIGQRNTNDSSQSMNIAIPFLKTRILRIMRQVRFHIDLRSCSNTILEGDALNLLREQNQGQRRAMKVESHLRCYACSRPIPMQPGAVAALGVQQRNDDLKATYSSAYPAGSNVYLSGIGNIADSTLWGPPPQPYLDTVHGKSFSTVNGVVVFSSKVAFHRTCYLQLQNQ